MCDSISHSKVKKIIHPNDDKYFLDISELTLTIFLKSFTKKMKKFADDSFKFNLSKSSLDKNYFSVTKNAFGLYKTA
jgi:hypothetical protein